MTNFDRKIHFSPAIELEREAIPSDVKIKGQKPIFSYPFRLADLYPEIPSLPPIDAYKQIKMELQKNNNLLHERFHARAKIDYPPVENEHDARNILSLLFDPRIQRTNQLIDSRTLQFGSVQGFVLDHVFPFPLRLASKEKIQHTLAWIDTNIKISVESIAHRVALPKDAIFQITESALRIYSIMIKQQDYYLAQLMNFNHSMFLQDRIINLIFGDDLFYSNTNSIKTGVLSNAIALKLLKSRTYTSPNPICHDGIFMGIIWTSDNTLQHRFDIAPEKTLGDIDIQLRLKSDVLVIDDINRLISELQNQVKPSVSVILDDTGESVFDIAFFQYLLTAIPDLELFFIVNKYPVSNNISDYTFRQILDDEYFTHLSKSIRTGQGRIITEHQPFRSFELAYLHDSTTNILKESTLIYIKGANFFETLRFTDKITYYAFTVYNEMSITLSGFPKGSGIFARIPPNQVPFIYRGPTRISTLRELREEELVAHNHDT